MLNLNYNVNNGTNTGSTSKAVSYASTVNARFFNNQSAIKTAQQRWVETYNARSAYDRQVIDYALKSAKLEFQRRNPHFTTWISVRSKLAKAWTAKMSNIKVDTTMQRQLNIEWVLQLLNDFVSTKVLPIQVYQPDPEVEEYHAWDGQHTFILLWLIATEIMNVNPEDIEIPVNLFDSSLKNEMRNNFVDLNSGAGKKALDLYDIFEQQVYGCRIDHSSNPIWLLAEKKQVILETHNLFVTKKSLGESHYPGAISRMQEVNKLNLESLENLCSYLVQAGANSRPVEEKEMMMMAYFFDRCRNEGISFTKTEILDIAGVALNHWNADFSPASVYWDQVNTAYVNWHSIHGQYSNSTVRCKKEPIHGYPFLVEQLRKDLPGIRFPSSTTGSNFVPNFGDLF